MKITICGSIMFTYEIKKIADKLHELGHTFNIPYTSEKILAGDLSLEEFKTEKKKNGDHSFRKMNDNVIKRYYDLISVSDAILVANITKNQIKNYIGGNTFLEIGFAYVLGKKIYLLNNIPDMLYTDEIKAMQPIILNNDFNKISFSSSPSGKYYSF